MLGFGLWWLARAEASARRKGEGYGNEPSVHIDATQDQALRERAATAHEFDIAEIPHGHRGDAPNAFIAALPLIVVVGVNLVISLLVLPRVDNSFLAEERWGPTTLAAVGGVWSVVVALSAAIVTLILLNWRRLTEIRDSVDAGVTASVLPAVSVASLVGFGAVVAAMPAFAMVRGWVLSIEGGPLVSLAVATNVLASLTGSASGGLTIALDTLGETYLRLAEQGGIDPALLHRVAVIGAGTLDSLPHNGAVVTLLAVCGCTHKESYLDIVVVAIVGAHHRARRRHRPRLCVRLILSEPFEASARRLARNRPLALLGSALLRRRLRSHRLCRSAFALNYLPYIGSLIVTVFPALFAFVQFDSWQATGIVFFVLAVIQFVIGSYLEPLISGSALAISPSVVTFTVVLWTFLWCLPGAFIGVPLAIAFLTLCAQFPSTQWIATMFLRSGANANGRSEPEAN